MNWTGGMEGRLVVVSVNVMSAAANT